MAPAIVAACGKACSASFDPIEWDEYLSLHWNSLPCLHEHLGVMFVEVILVRTGHRLSPSRLTSWHSLAAPALT